jgi:hypothetical protein
MMCYRPRYREEHQQCERILIDCVPFSTGGLSWGSAALAEGQEIDDEPPLWSEDPNLWGCFLGPSTGNMQNLGMAAEARRGRSPEFVLRAETLSSLYRCKDGGATMREPGRPR